MSDKENTYIEINPGFGVKNIETDLELYQDVEDKGFYLGTDHHSCWFGNREELAEFLWMCVILVDSEERFKPQEDLVGINYDDHKVTLRIVK